MINTRNINSSDIVNKMREGSVPPLKPVPAVNRVIFVFADGELVRVTVSEKEPNEYVLTQLEVRGIAGKEVRYNTIEFDTKEQAIEFATNIIIDCQPPLLSRRLPAGHDYFDEQKICLHYYVDNKNEMDELFGKYGIVVFGNRYVHGDAVRKFFPSDRIKLPSISE